MAVNFDLFVQAVTEETQTPLLSTSTRVARAGEREEPTTGAEYFGSGVSPEYNNRSVTTSSQLGVKK